jgi:hypothetical protein
LRDTVNEKTTEKEKLNEWLD